MVQKRGLTSEPIVDCRRENAFRRGACPRFCLNQAENQFVVDPYRGDRIVRRQTTQEPSRSTHHRLVYPPGLCALGSSRVLTPKPRPIRFQISRLTARGDGAWCSDLGTRAWQIRLGT